MKLHPRSVGERGAWSEDTWEAGERQAGLHQCCPKVIQIDSTNKNKTGAPGGFIFLSLKRGK